MQHPELKRVLEFRDIFALTLGQIIGAGIMTYTGIAIGITGRSVAFSFLLASFFILCMTVPILMANGTVRFDGGQYSQVSTLLSEKLGGFFIIVFISTNMVISMFALSFGDYFVSFFNFGNSRVVAATIMTLLYGINILGVDKVAKFSRVILTCLLIAFGLFLFHGFSHITPNYFREDFLQGGIFGFLRASALVTFAIGGGTNVVNLAGECKDPTRDLPRAVLSATIIVSLFYSMIAVVAAGVLPVDQVANQPLTWVAKEVLSPGEFAYFCVGGALLALISPLNGQFSWATKPVYQACLDGWFPKKLAALHKKYNTPVYLLTILYVVGIFPILVGIDFAILGNAVVVLFQICNIMTVLSLYGLEKKYPKIWMDSKFYRSPGTVHFIVILAISVIILQIGILMCTMGKEMGLVIVLILIFAAIYSYFRYETGNVHPLQSMKKAME